jgi:hypothetical protein
MSQSMLLPAFFALFGVVAAMFMLGFGNAELLVDDDDFEDADRNAGYAVEYGGDETFVDDDEYLEYTVSWDEPEPAAQAQPVVQADESVTEPMRSRADHLLHAPAEPWHSAPVESWHSLLEPEPFEPEPFEPEPFEPEPPAPAPEPPREPWRSILDKLLGDLPAQPKVEPIGFAHNGFHVDEERRFQPLPPPAPERATPSRHERPARHFLPEEQPEKRPFWFESNDRHSREGPDDASTYGRHSMPGRD